MKNVTGPSYVKSPQEELELWSAEIELDHVKFARTANTAIEFKNQIDVWSKMEFRFRQQIQDLKLPGGARQHNRPDPDQHELKTLFYSIRERLE